PAADDDDRLDGAVRFRLLDPALEPIADGLRHSVHRRRVNRDERDLAFNRKVDDRIDGGHAVFPPERARRTPTKRARGMRLFGDAENMLERAASSGQLPAPLETARPGVKEFRCSL